MIMNAFSFRWTLRSALPSYGLALIFSATCAFLTPRAFGGDLPLRQYGLGRVQVVAYSPQGNTFLSGGSAGAAYLWDIAAGKVIRRYSGHAGAIAALAYSKDGGRILTGSLDGTARLWNTNTGALIRRFTGHAGAVLAVAFYPDGSRVLTGSADDTARVWDAGSGKPFATLTGHGADITSVAVSPDGARLLTGSNDGTARLWNAATGTRLSTLNVQNPVASWFRMTYVAFFPDGTTLLTVELPHQVKLWETASGSLIRSLDRVRFFIDYAYGADLSPDGKWLILSGYARDDGWSEVVDLNTNEVVRGIGGTRWHQNAAFAPDSRKVLLASRYDELKVADLTTTQSPPPQRAYFGHSNSVLALALSPDGARLLTANGADDSWWDGKLRMFEQRTGSFIREFRPSEPPTPPASLSFAGASFSPDGARVEGVGSRDFDYYYSWDAATGKTLAYNGTDFGHYLVYSPDGQWRASFTLVQNRVDPMKSRGFSDLQSQCGAFSADSQRVALGSVNRFLIWSMYSDNVLTVTAPGAGIIKGLVWSPDGGRIVSGGEDKAARIWNARTGTHVRTLTGHQGVITGVAWSPNGRLILTGSLDKTARLWDAQTGALLKTLATPSEILAVLFARDGSSFYTASQDGIVSLWRVELQSQAHGAWREYE